MKKAIVLGGSYVALAVVKSLAREGVQVILVTSEPRDHAWFSRFVSQRVQSPNPMDKADELVDFLINAKEDWDGALLIPSSDEYVIFVSQNRDKLEARYAVAVQDWDVIGSIINKDSLYLQAQKVGVPTPRFFLPNSVQFLDERRDDFVYPCILKPHETHKFNQSYKEKVLMVHDFQELRDKFAETRQKELRVMISEIIPGDDASLFHYRSYIDSQGNVLAEMCTQKLRQYPMGFGQASVARTVPIIQEIRRMALNLLESFSYRGESSAEFRFDHRDGQYKLMEINARPVLPEWHFVAAGINFPYLTFLDLVENTRTPCLTYRHEVYWMHNFWEAINFVKLLVSRELDLKDFLGPYRKSKVFCMPFSDDPIHFMSEIYLNAKKVLSRRQV